MIKEIKCYTLICDNCGADLNKDSECSCWTDKVVNYDTSQYQISEKFIEIDDSMIVNPLSMFDDKDYYIDRVKKNEKINLEKINDKIKDHNIDIEVLLSESRRI